MADEREPTNELLNTYSNDRITKRQVDELIGMARGIIADEYIHEKEVLALEDWLMANSEIYDHPLLGVLYRRVQEITADGYLDEDEAADLFEILSNLVRKDYELGEVLKATTLPLCNPAPTLTFPERVYCFTGTFLFGTRKDCETAIEALGGVPTKSVSRHVSWIDYNSVNRVHLVLIMVAY